VPWNLDTCSTQRSPVHWVQLHDALNRDTHLHPLHNNSSVFLTTTTYVQRSGRIINGTRSGQTTPQDSALQFQTPVHTHPGMTLPRRAWVRLNRLLTGVKRFHSCLYKWGMVSSAAYECGPEQTVNHVVFHCPIHRPPRTTWPDGSGRWDNRRAAQHLPRYLGGLAVDKKKLAQTKEEEL